MQQAIPYRSWTHNTSTTHFNVIKPHILTTTKIHNTIDESSHRPSSFNINNEDDKVMFHNMVSENAVIVFARHGCCMSHVVKRLLLGLGVNPAVHEVEEKDEVDVVKELESIANEEKVQFPAVFIGGNLFGGLDRIMATHISGELVPILKQAGALWL